MTKSRKARIRFEEGSGNVFADLDVEQPEQELLKARLTLQIHKLIKARGLTQAKAGEILGIKRPHVSALMRNRAGTFSVERLMQFLTNLGQDIEITFAPHARSRGGSRSSWRRDQRRGRRWVSLRTIPRRCDRLNTGSHPAGATNRNHRSF